MAEPDERSDMPKATRLCDEPGCDRVHRGRGLCVMHWKRKYGQRTKYPSRCITCGVDFPGERRTAKFCSDACKGDAYRTHCKLPSEHPVMLLISAARVPREPRPEPVAVSRECEWCGDGFTTMKQVQKFCRFECKRKAMKVRRRGREHGSTSHYTWAEVMRLFVGKFNRCCAYCERPIEGQPDPDHVVPLSRGGSNGITNVLPCCSPCNSDKRDLLLHEWAVDRERRGLPPRLTDVSADPRWQHLTDALLAAA